MTHSQTYSSFNLRCPAALLSLLTAWFGVACSDDASPARTPDAAPVTSTTDAGTTGPAAPPQWTMMGKDATNTYHQTAETRLGVANAKNLAERWRFSVDGFSTGSAAVAEGKVFILATGGLYALSLDSGRVLWSTTAISGTASPAYADGFLYIHASVGATLYKVKASDGSVVWGPMATYPAIAACDGTSSPIVADDKVLVGHCCGAAEVGGGPDQVAARGGVEAFSRETGERVWTYWTVPESGENGAMVWSTVGVDLAAKVVYATTGNNYNVSGPNSDAIHAIDLNTGVRVWMKQVRDGDLWSLPQQFSGPDTDFGANPILAEVGGRSVVAAGDKGSAFWVLDRKTGDIVWSRSELSARHAPNTGGMLNNGAFDGKNFYVASNQPAQDPEPIDSLLHFLDGVSGEDVRTPIRLGATVWGALSIANGLLFVPVNTALHVYDTATGERLTMFDTGGTIAGGAPAIVDGNIIVKSGLEYMYGYDAVSNDQVICYGIDPPAAPGDDATPVATGAPTFDAIYKEVIVKSGCAGSALCHSSDAGHLTMKDRDSTYDALVGVQAMGTDLLSSNCSDTGLLRVSPGKPDESLLVQKLEGTQTCGSQMPIGGRLSDDKLKQIRTWISNGAKKDG